MLNLSSVLFGVGKRLSVSRERRGEGLPRKLGLLGNVTL